MAGKSRPTPLTNADRAVRDQLILDLFLLGFNKPQIAVHPAVKKNNAGGPLTVQRVGDILNVELERARTHQIVFNEKAMVIHVARMELLIQEAMSHVQSGEMKAIEPARRLLEAQAKLFGLADDVNMSLPPMSDTEMTDDVDELTKYRLQKGVVPPKKAAGET